MQLLWWQCRGFVGWGLLEAAGTAWSRALRNALWVAETSPVAALKAQRLYLADGGTLEGREHRGE